MFLDPPSEAEENVNPCSRRQVYLAVVGPGKASPDVYAIAVAIGRAATLRGWIVLTGGLGGVMEGAAKGAKETGGLTLGILPGGRREDANPYIDIAVATHTHEARNVIIAQTADALIAIDGEYGTLSEVALGLKLGKPVVAINPPWAVPGLTAASNPEEAIDKIEIALGIASSAG
jgi:uncharacterized protein (TIGR00725 family)